MKPFAGSNTWVTPRQPAALVAAVVAAIAAAVIAVVVLVTAAVVLDQPAVT
jgi:hypothetical protein